jgi:hypothetical protein
MVNGVMCQQSRIAELSDLLEFHAFVLLGLEAEQRLSETLKNREGWRKVFWSAL